MFSNATYYGSMIYALYLKELLLILRLHIRLYIDAIFHLGSSMLLSFSLILHNAVINVLSHFHIPFFECV